MRLKEMNRNQIVECLLDKLSSEELAGFLGLSYEDFLKLDSGEVVDNLISTVKFAVVEDIEDYLKVMV